MLEAMRKGWCPGALRPMLTGDGYLARLRLTNGELSPGLLSTLADLAETLGNGLVDLSARANLCLRGLSQTTAVSLQDALREKGLLDAAVEAEAVRNVIASPLAGFDDDAVLDARPVVAALEARLTQDRALRALPPKFGFLVDGGGRLPLTGIEADVALEAFWAPAGPRLALRVGGAFAGAVEPAAAADAASAAALAFLALRRDERRMRDLLRRVSLDEILHRSGVDRREDEPPARRPRLAMTAVLGAQEAGASAWVGAAAAFGSFRSCELGAFAECVRACGGAAVRLTPWRALLAPGLTMASARTLAKDLGRAGLIVDGADARLRVAACAGRPRCASAYADARGAALVLARHWRGAGTLHVSGCGKGCAHPGRAPITLVASSDGAFDLVENGTARGAPARRGLDLAAVIADLERNQGAPH